MKVRGLAHSLFVCTGMLKMAAILVPRAARAEWLEEWRAELWHVWHICNQNDGPAALHQKDEITAFSLGAFKDALWLRRNHASAAPSRISCRGWWRWRASCGFLYGKPHTPPCPARSGRKSGSLRWFRQGMPSRCILTFAVLAAVSLLLAHDCPRVWKVIQPSPYRDASDLVMVSRGGFETASHPTVEFSEYEAWSRNSHRLFTGLAFYRLTAKRLTIGTDSSAELPIARASANLFEMLGVPISFEVRGIAAYPTRLVLSRSAWLKYFHGDDHVFGHVLQVDGQQAIIAGVVQDEDWRLPGQTDLWLLEDARHLSSLQPDTVGYVLGHASRSIFPVGRDGRRQMYVAKKEGGYDWFVCRSLADRIQEPLSIFSFALLLACLALPATTSLPLGEYTAHSSHVPWTTRVRRWAFLSAKFILIVPIVYFGSLDLAYSSGSMSVGTSELLEVFSSFWALLLAFRWALRDQRRRCPVCLCTLTNPARVGQFSRNFLAWNGTELVCLSGHGLLHVPDIPTSWFSNQRWLYLDPSWSALFPVGT
jgi:hypothetical protein